MTMSPNWRMVEIRRTTVFLGALLLLAAFFSFAQTARAGTLLADQPLVTASAEQVEYAGVPASGEPANDPSAYSGIIAFLECGDRTHDDRDGNPDTASAGSPGADCLWNEDYLQPPAPAVDGFHFRISDPLSLLSTALRKIGARAPPSA
jgi:hypothetical protein